MKELQMVSLLCITGASVLYDLHAGRIPNGITAAGLLCGLAWQLFANGASGAILFFGGTALPLLVFGVFYFFRMIGAGDLKLLCTVGGFVGPGACFSCITAAVFFGGLISLAVMLHRRSFCRRMFCFFEYVSDYSDTKQWKPYLKAAGEEDRFCFSIPVLLSVLCYIGGIF